MNERTHAPVTPEERLYWEYVDRVMGVIREMEASSEIEILAALGRVCPAGTQRQKAIWLAACHRFDPWIEAKPADRSHTLLAVARVA